MDTGHRGRVISLRGISEYSPLDIDGYRKLGGFKALEKAINIDSGEIISVIEESGLRGRGGAGFPTGMKWKFAYKASGKEKYVIANADEGEPGTFKDRYIMERAPFRFLEGLIISALAIGAKDAYIYIRHEYSKSITILKEAISILNSETLQGENISGSGITVNIHIATGAGSYLCGDETTLLESMEGKRGNPRYKPPFPAETGFRNNPTVVNNVETLAHVPYILLNGAKQYRNIGTKGSPGTKLYCLSGRVKNPGVYELPMGTTLKELLFDVAGGMSAKESFKGALLGGAAGTFVNRSLLEVPMDYDALKEKSATLGAGAVIIFSNNDNVSDMLLNIMQFFKHESCGKCVPCRVGCHRLENFSLELFDNKGKSKEILNKMSEESSLMAATSLCGLGQSPVLPIKSAIKYFADEL